MLNDDLAAYLPTYLPTYREWMSAAAAEEEENSNVIALSPVHHHRHTQYQVYRQLSGSGRLSACTLALARGRVLLGVELMEQPGR